MKQPSHILITGASGAIGSALAECYAQPGITLHLHGQDRVKLADTAARCRARGATVHCWIVDLQILDSIAPWLTSVGRIDLLIINAGRNCHHSDDGEPEPWQEVEALLEVNLKAAMLMARSVIPGMRKQGFGQIAFVSSLAAYFGLPMTSSYCASKAAIKAYGESLRGWLRPDGISVNVIMPGYVKSDMCDAMPGPKPWLWSPQRAARYIKRGLHYDVPRISFPFPLNWGSWWLAVLPTSLSLRIVSWLGYGR